MSKPILILGATGHTGGLLCLALARRSVPVIAAGRDLERLEVLSHRCENIVAVRLADPTRTETLLNLCHGAAAVINCAGPFTELAAPVVRAAIAQRTPYLDCSGEFGCNERVFRLFAGPAREAGVAVLPGMNFDALADLAAHTLLKQTTGVAALHIIEAVAGVRRPNPAGLKSTIRTLAAGGRVYRDGELRAEPPGARRRTFGPDGVTGWSVPVGVLLTIPRHCSVPTVISYATLQPGEVRLLRLAALLRALLASRLFLRAADAWVDRRFRAPVQDGSDRWQILLEAEAADGRVIASGRLALTGVYQATAEILAEAAVRVRDGQVTATGVLAPAEAFPAAEFLAHLPGVEWSV